MSKWKALMTPKGFVTFLVLISIVWPTYHYYEKWKNKPAVIPATEPVVLDNGKTVYTLHHRDPRGEKLKIYPWTVTLPSDAYVWREEEIEGSLRNLQVNRASLNTTVRTNSTLFVWLKLPNLEFVTKKEEKLSDIRNAVDAGNSMRISFWPILQMKKEISEYNKTPIDQQYIICNQNELLEVNNRCFKPGSSRESFNVIDKDTNLEMRCSKFNCNTSHIIKDYVQINISVSFKKADKLSEILVRIEEKISDLIKYSEDAKRTAW